MAEGGKYFLQRSVLMHGFVSLLYAIPTKFIDACGYANTRRERYECLRDDVLM